MQIQNRSTAFFASKSVKLATLNSFGRQLGRMFFRNESIPWGIQSARSLKFSNAKHQTRTTTRASFTKMSSIDRSSRMFLSTNQLVKPPQKLNVILCTSETKSDTLQNFKTLVNNYISKGNFNRAAEALQNLLHFVEMALQKNGDAKKQQQPIDLETINIILSFYALTKDTVLAKQTFDQIADLGLKPNYLSYSELAKCYSRAQDLAAAMNVHEEAKKNLQQLPILNYIPLLEAISSNRTPENLQIASNLFQEIISSNLKLTKNLFALYLDVRKFLSQRGSAFQKKKISPK